MQFDVKRAIAANWPIKVTALALATVLWAAVAAEEPTTQLIPISVTVTTPANRTLTQQLPPVQAVYEGSARELIKLYTSPPLIRIVVPDTLSESVYTFDLSPQDVILAADADVALRDVIPQRLTIVLDDEAQRRVPVVPRVTLQTDSGFVVTGPVTAVPESVLVIGPEAQVRRIGRVYTDSLAIRRVRESVTRTIPIDTTAFGVVRLSQHEVEVQAAVEAVAERTIAGVPVVIASGVWASIPSTVQLHVTGPAALVRALTGDRFIVTADSTTSEGEMVSVQVVAPEGVTATVSPDSVQARRVIL
jgi:YbbR domain-containing protein